MAISAAATAPSITRRDAGPEPHQTCAAPPDRCAHGHRGVKRALLRAATVFYLVATVPAFGQDGAPLLFRVIGPRDEVTIGMSQAEFNTIGQQPGAERLARKLVSDGQLTAWRYVVGRAPDGTTRMAATDRIAILRSDALRIEPYRAALPVANPPATP
jgi:hypothetical protein